ncbi:MAG TPA: DUF6690 family protein [Planctomycetaceae bacterium]|nr:DUF6690 family protein [Planctomycetaceae bacterium]
MRFLPAILVFGAAGAGYVYTHDGLVKSISPSNWISDEGAATVSDPAVVERLASAPKEHVIVVPGPDISNFGDVFRFDLNPHGIAQKWSRVSTGLSDVRLQGYRVPLVTGTSESDLAGSLTYYFDGKPRLRRITFLGTTANPQRLIDFLSQNYGFRRFQNGGARAMIWRARYRYTGYLSIAPAEVLDKNLASTNYRIELSLEH